MNTRKLKKVLIMTTVTMLFSACSSTEKNATNVCDVDVTKEVVENQEVTIQPEVSEEVSLEKTQTPEETTTPEVSAQPVDDEEDTGYPYFCKIKYPGKDLVTAKDDTVVKPFKLQVNNQKENEIIDEEDWFKSNDLKLNAIAGYYPECAKDTLSVEGYSVEIFQMSPYNVAYDDKYIYEMTDTNIIVYPKETGQPLYNVDLADFCYATDDIYSDRVVRWATSKDNILYVMICYLGYATPDSSYILAIDMDSMELLWKSESQTCNGNNFIIKDDVIICSYGFTDEDDYIYQLNAKTGEVLDKKAIKTQAYYLIEKDKKLYVRCYDTDYEFTYK